MPAHEISQYLPGSWNISQGDLQAHQPSGLSEPFSMIHRGGEHRYPSADDENDLMPEILSIWRQRPRARGARPAPSAMTLFLSMSVRMAEAISSSPTVTI